MLENELISLINTITNTRSERNYFIPYNNTTF